MRKIFFFSLFFFIALSSCIASANPDFKETAEKGWSSSVSSLWTQSSNGGASTLSILTYPTDSGRHCIYMKGGSSSGYDSYYKSLKSSSPIFSDYFGFRMHKLFRYTNTDQYNAGDAKINLVQNGATVASYTIYSQSWGGYGSSTTLSDTVYEFVRSGDHVYVYKNGVSVADMGAVPQGEYQIEFYVSGYNRCYIELWLDDLSTESCIGISPEWNEFQTSLSLSYRIQGLSQHPNYTYAVNLYALSGDNAGLINSTYISNSSHAGSCTWDMSILNENYGLYFVSLSRDDLELDSDYFVYSLSTDPIPYPEILFIAGANAEAEIRDEDLNGGTISGGGSVYLYPSVNENGVYNITYDILETPYSLEATIQTVYNTSPINQTNFLFSGLSSQSYYVSVDGEEIESTHNLDTWDYTINNSSANHVFNFDLDYRAPGVWGYIKNSETQSPIKSATVTVSNGSNTYYLFTDSNGMYYKTRDMIPGSYNVSAAKSGYTASVPYNAPTQENLTSRQDIFLDPIQGSGVYYASHDVTFTVLEYWYSSAGLPSVSYAVYDDENESVKNGTTGSKGTFTVKDMDAGKNYTFILTYNNQTYTEYLEPGLIEYTLVLNKEGIVHQYFNSWLNLTYAENSDNATILYTSNKTVSEASLTVSASNGTIVQSSTLNTT